MFQFTINGITVVIQLQDILRVVFWFLFGIGLWRIFHKCRHRGWTAFIPGARLYVLSECADRESDGVVAFFTEVAVIAINDVVLPIVGEDSETGIIVSVVGLGLALILLIFSMRIFGGLCQTFGRRKRWIILWVLTSSLTALIWGFGRRFQPVNLGRDNDDDLLAGTSPAALAMPETLAASITAPTPADEGLHISLKSRTVRDFLKKRYLLKDINVVIPNGSLVLLLGGSGSGKTTFVNAITGYEKASAKMILNGEDIYKNYDQMKYRIGFVPQQDLLRMNDTVIRTLEDAADLRLPLSMSAAETRARINSVMDTLGLTAGQNGLVAKKSGGQKKRISIGMELVSDPDLFILDEPDSGLDGVIARELFTKLRQVADQGNIVIAITHTPDRVADLFDKVIVLARDSGRVGRLAFYGTPDEARKFFGKSRMEEIVMAVNRKEEGGEGRADEFINAYAYWAEKASDEAAKYAAGQKAAGRAASENTENAEAGTSETAGLSEEGAGTSGSAPSAEHTAADSSQGGESHAENRNGGAV